ncbi:MAG: Vms1/Ankzf1 family peptidyl-tRNA hydrolase [Kineosporiaceae bacterium]
MKLTDLQDLAAPGDGHATVALDVSRTDEGGDHGVALRWRTLREHLERAGADAATVAVLERAVLEPTGRGGSVGVFAVARAGALLHRRVLPRAPVRDEAVLEALPHLMPLVRALDGGTRYVLVEVDRAGADVAVVDAGAGEPVGDVVTEAESTAGHDVLRKVPGGGWSHRRYQARAEDSWEHNARAVADDLDDLVRRHGAELVVVTGVAQSRALVMERLSPATAALAVAVEGGSRHDDLAPGEGEVHPAVAETVERHVHDRRRRVLAEFAEEIGREAAGVHGLDDVVDALRRGQVREVVLVDDPTSTLRLWVGEDPLTVGSRDEVVALGAQEPREVRADAAVVAAAAATDAGVTVIPGHPDDAGDLLDVVALRDGIGARLRYADRSTPHDERTAMTRGGGTDTTGG